MKNNSLRRIVLLCALTNSYVLANTEFIVNSIYNSATPYMIVTHDSEGVSHREPGIYYPSIDGKWIRFITGSVLSGGTQQGILLQLSLTKKDQRYAALAVVDKKLRLFQINSKSMNDKSVITFGEGDGQV